MSRQQMQKLPVVEVCQGQFTLEQANRSLVLVERIVRDALEYYEQVLEYQEILDRAQRRGDEARADRCQDVLYILMEKLQDCSDELLDVGVELKDWSAGAVDFPAVLDGRDVNFCWRYGEPTVRFFHEPYDLCESRRLIRQEMQTVN